MKWRVFSIETCFSFLFQCLACTFQLPEAIHEQCRGSEICESSIYKTDRIYILNIFISLLFHQKKFITQSFREYIVLQNLKNSLKCNVRFIYSNLTLVYKVFPGRKGKVIIVTFIEQNISK